MKLTKEERTTLLNLLDQVNVRGLDSKRKVLSLMEKLMSEDASAADDP